VPRKKINFKYKKERIVLSDILPYEIPITFSNRHFYDFLLSNGIEYKNGNIEWVKDDDALEEIIKLMFGIKRPVKTETISRFDRNVQLSSFKKNKKNPINFFSVPFGYKISHKENEYRELAICHPRNQLQIVDFYNEFKELIIYYCSISPFSIRKPQKVSKYIYHKDKTHYDIVSDEKVIVEEFDKEYENLKSFFVYKDCSNVYKFYESYKYHRCEKKYNKLLKLDISKCFDSIYTHSLAWALLNKDSVKESLGGSKKTFAGRFDVLMQQINYNETNGIIIGPEFSRIFAELLLQSVDKKIEQTLRDEYNLKHKSDYEIFRYVDDFFIFYNEESDRERIIEVLQIELKNLKLCINAAKTLTYDKPIITEISIAKNKLASLLDEKLIYKLESSLTEPDIKKGSINISSKQLITEFKTIVKECSVDYKDILNYSLSIVEKRCEKIIKNFHLAEKNENSEKQLVKAIIDILDFVFFIYSVSPRVNTTIKLCRITELFVTFLKRKIKNQDLKHLVFKFIYDEVCFVLKKNKNSKHTQVETLYLLVVLSELGKNYWLEESILLSYFNLSKNEVGGDYTSHSKLNYFSITVLLFYIKNKKCYDDLRSLIEYKIKEKFDNSKQMIWKDTELTLLLFDSIACPYIKIETKRHLLSVYDINDHALQTKIISKRLYWFTKWHKFDFEKELDSKHSQEVY
jgi:hypothetical protein